jgi:hypothetical protein
MEISIFSILNELVQKVSRKSIILAIAMILIYMIVTTTVTTHVVLSILVISMLATLGAVLQYCLDIRKIKEKEKG